MHLGVALLLHPAARIALTDFTVHPSTVIGLAGLGALYHWRAGQRPAERTRHRRPRASAPPSTPRSR
jgi:hypothetical protein